MTIAFIRNTLAGLALLGSVAAQAGVILETPDTVQLGDTFDVSVVFDAAPALQPSEAVVGFDFLVADLLGISLVGSSVADDFLPLVTAPPGANIAGSSLLGVADSRVALATLTFSADTLGAAGAAVEGFGTAVPFPGGVLIQDALTGEFFFRDIEAAFGVQVVEASSVPLPATFALIVFGLLALRRRQR